MSNLIGYQLGNYRLIRLLGQGGFADIYLGEHLFLKTSAAVKVLQGKMTPQDVQNFIREARTIATLKHPHIVRILEFGVDNSVPFLIMDFASDGTLRDRHPRGSILPFTTILSYVKQIAGALQYAHDQSLIHRDIKPENMLVESNNNLLLTDFGIAVVVTNTRTQTTKEVIGTFHYMAPELFRGKPVPASDQYALACVVYEWLSGECVFDGDVVELIAKHSSDPPRPFKRSLQIPSQVEHVVFKALAKDPHHRFASVQEFATALEQALKGQELKEKIILDKPFISISPNLQQTLQGHTSVILRLIWSRDGSILASTGNDKTIRLWNAQTGEEMRTLTGHSSGVNQVAWSAKGDIFVSCCNDHSMSIWETATGNLLRHMEHAHLDDIPSIAWSPDGQILASGSGDTAIKLWHINSNKDFQFLRMLEGHKGGVQYVAWSPDGKKLASCSWDTSIRIWDTVSWVTIRTLHGHTDGIICIDWSPDNSTLASASHDSTVRIWDTKTGEEKKRFTDHKVYVRSVSFSCDGRLLASNSPEIPYRPEIHSEGKVRIRRADTWEQVAVIPERVNWWWVPGLAFHPNKPNILATLGEYDRVIHIWKLVYEQSN